MQQLSTHVSLNDFGRLFQTFQKTAFRFESRPVYDVPAEQDEYRAFLSGGKPDPGFGDDWHQLIRRPGVSFQRVRLFQMPLTDYLRFEIQWCYSKSREAGEDIRFLINHLLDTFKKDVPILKDFWLFDSQHVFLMDYDDVGRFFGCTLADKKLTPAYVAFAQKLYAMSLSFDEGLRTCEKV